MTVCNSRENPTTQIRAVTDFWPRFVADHRWGSKLINARDAIVLESSQVAAGNAHPFDRCSTLLKKGENYLDESGFQSMAYQVNRVANMAILEWPTNVAISDKDPKEYFPELMEKYVPEHVRPDLMFWHASPTNWETMEYAEFLGKRQKMVAAVIKQSFEKISKPYAIKISIKTPSLESLLRGGESEEVEFKSSLFSSYERDILQYVITGSAIKTIAGFLNTSGGTLVIGVAGNKKVLSIAMDLKLKNFSINQFEQALSTLIQTNISVHAATDMPRVFWRLQIRLSTIPRQSTRLILSYQNTDASTTESLRLPFRTQKYRKT